MPDVLSSCAARAPRCHQRLFADYWFGQIGVQKERCLAEERAKRAPRFAYDYNTPGGWAPLDMFGRQRATPRWPADAAKGG